jgi:Zinc finger, C2H2 type
MIFLGPLLAPKSYVPPSRPNKFSLVVFNEVWNGDPFLDELSDDIKELFNVRNYYLDTSDENKCNWMIHVDIAKYSNEQNLMAYQENDQIYYTSTRDIELGDILKVWYSPSYATRMRANMLKPSDSPGIFTNILQQVSFDYGIKLHEEKEAEITNNNYLTVAPLTSSPFSEITLPPINSIMKTQSSNYNNLDFDNLLVTKNEQLTSYQSDFSENYQLNLNDQFTSSDSEKNTQSPSSVTNMKFTEVHESDNQKFACEICSRKYITKSNLEKHMRSHDLFMCVVCMKVGLFLENSDFCNCLLFIAFYPSLDVSKLK